MSDLPLYVFYCFERCFVLTQRWFFTFCIIAKIFKFNFSEGGGL